MQNIRNFGIIAHIDHGKSTLADRMLELTHTIESRKMKDQVLDNMELERERGITIKMQPVRMLWHSHRRINADLTQNDAEEKEEFLYSDLTYKIRGILFKVRKNLGLGHKEQVYHSALEIEFRNEGIKFESKKNISIIYSGQKIGMYQPDFIIEEKILIELKTLPEIGRPQTEQVWSYLKGCDYKLALLVNFGSKELEIKRIVYDIARKKDSAFSASVQQNSAGVSDKIEDEYILNLIDTPGHIDFSYEVSRALSAVEGVILLIDATQGVEAQTISVLAMAKDQGLIILPVLSKIDSPLARISEVKAEIVSLIGCKEEEIIETSGKTGEGVEALLEAIIQKIPPPTIADFTQKNAEVSANSAPVQRESANALCALVFDFKYSTHKGIIVFVRVMQGQVSARENLIFRVAKEKFISLETGVFKPDETPKESLKAGEIGYITTGIKTPGIVSVGDTIGREKEVADALPGFGVPMPVVWASIFPEDQGDLLLLRQSLAKLKLTDSSLYYEEESSGVLGKGFRCGFLGMLHLEIITERLKREFNLYLVITQPSITYNVEYKNHKTEKIFSPAFFPEDGLIEKVEEPWVNALIITPAQYVGNLLPLLYEHEAEITATENFGGDPTSLKLRGASKTNIHALMPLRELMRGFFDKLKSVSQGYASLSYEKGEVRQADVTKLSILIGGEEELALSRVVSKRIVEREAESIVDKLKNLLPRQMFEIKIQAKAQGRIIASRTLSAFRKDVTQHMYGGDITRKMKLREKQKKGKKKMRERGKIRIPQDIFIKIMKPD